MNTIHIILPVQGQSFLPADWVFGQVEKLLRKQPTTFHKADYIDVFKSVRVVKLLGEDWYDTKGLSSKEHGKEKRHASATYLRRGLVERRHSQMVP